MADARREWERLEALASASPYQTFAFCKAWMETQGAASRATPLIGLARAPGGEAVALLPLCRFRRGPLVVAELQGGRMANYQMGLFRDPEHFSRDDVEALLRRIAEIAGVDLFLFLHQPVSWRGRPNPLRRHIGAAEPELRLFDRPRRRFCLLDARPSFRRYAQEAPRQDAQAGDPRPRRALRAATLEQRRAALAAFLRQKRARMESLGLRDEFDDTSTRAFVAKLAGLDGDAGVAGFEFHVVEAGDRIVSVYAGLLREGRLSGLLLSHDIAAEVAQSSPGEFMILSLVEDAYARGLRSLDFGVGEARNKSEACEIVEPLFDSAFATTRLGRIGAIAYLVTRRLKRRIKQTRGLFDFARAVQRFLFRRRAR